MAMGRAASDPIVGEFQPCLPEALEEKLLVERLTDGGGPRDSETPVAHRGGMEIRKTSAWRAICHGGPVTTGDGK